MGVNRMDDLISRQAAIDAIMGQPPEPYKENRDGH